MSGPVAQPLVSIIVRSMDRPELAGALRALAAQQYAPLEVIVVDATGGAHAPLPQVEWRQGHSVRLVQNGQRLIRPLAAQIGLEAVAGEWFGFLDDDDSCEPTHVASLVAAAEAHPDAVVVYGRGCELDANGHPVRLFGRPFNRALMHYSPLLFWQSALVATRVRTLGARFDPALEVCEDRDFLAQCEALGRFVFVPGLASFRFRPDLGTSGTGRGNNRDALRKARFETLLRARWAGPGAWHHEHAAAGCARGIHAFREGRLDVAKACFLGVLDAYPGDPNALHALARVALARNDGHAAVLYADAALEVNPFPAEYRGTLAEAHALRDAQARRTTSVAAAVQPSSVRVDAPQPPPSRNAPCPCGSGERYKACCGKAGNGAASPAPPVGLVDTQPFSRRDDQLEVAARLVRRGEADRALVLLKRACTAEPTRERLLTAAQVALSLDDAETAIGMLSSLATAASDAVVDQLLQACGEWQHRAIAHASLWREAHARAALPRDQGAEASVTIDTLLVDADGPDPADASPVPGRVIVRTRAADPAPLVRCMARIDARWPGIAMEFTRPARDLPAGGSPMPVAYPEIDPALLELQPRPPGMQVTIGRPGPVLHGEEHPDDGTLLRELLGDGHALALPRSAFIEQAFADEPLHRRPRLHDGDAAAALADIDIALFRAAPGREGAMDARILAAMAAARPVVVFAGTLAAREWIDEGVTGFIVGSAAAARERIAMLARSAAMRAQVGTAARARARAILDEQWERLAPLYRGVRRNV